MPEISIALVGKTGHGKSSTGNTILRKEKFHVSDTSTYATKILTVEREDFGDYEVIVYDLPGLESQVLSEEHHARQMFSLMEVAKYIDLFIFVYPYATRYTKEEEKAFSFLQKHFGPDFLKEHGMIVITHGDCCKQDSTHDKISTENVFKKWCEQSGDKFNSIINMVSDRILLVCNKGSFENNNERVESSKQIHELALKMFGNRKPYTKEEFDKIHKSCEIL